MKVLTKDAKPLALFVVVVLIAAFALACVMLATRLFCEYAPSLPPAYPGGILN